MSGDALGRGRPGKLGVAQVNQPGGPHESKFSGLQGQMVGIAESAHLGSQSARLIE
jgi:hypothetical protein